MKGIMKTLLIDVDGTLIDSFPGIRASFLAALDDMGLDHPDEEFVSSIAGPPMEQTMARLGLSPDEAQVGLHYYLGHFGDDGWSNATPFDGMRKFLAWAKDAGFQLLTATSKGEEFARMSLERFGMLEYFDFLAAAQEDGPRRTKEKVIRYALDNLPHPADTSEMLLIGDRIHDIEGAREFSIPAVLVEWGYGTPTEHREAHHVVATPQELKEYVHDWSEA